jgi:hypothetical protein
LKILLEQERSDEAEEFLKTVSAEHLHVSDFSVYSIGIIWSCWTDRPIRSLERFYNIL